MKKLLKTIIFLAGLLLGAYGILLITLPFIGTKTQAVITGVMRPLPQLQDGFKHHNLQIVAFMFNGEDGRAVTSYSLHLSPALGLLDAGDPAEAFRINTIPQLSALEDDAGIRLINGGTAAVGLLIALLMLPWKRRKVKTQPKAASRPRRLQPASRRRQYCLACGQKLPRTARYCTGCGTRDPFGEEMVSGARTGQGLEPVASKLAVQPASLKAIRFRRTSASCPSCAAPIRPGQNFCQECGASTGESANETEGELQPAQAEGDSSPQPGDIIALAKGTDEAPARGDDQTVQPSANTAVREGVPRKKRKSVRLIRITAVLLLLVGISAGLFYRQQIVYAAAHFYFGNQWRFTKGKAEDEKKIRDTLDAAANAMKSGDVDAACGYVFPPNADRIRALFQNQPGYMEAMAQFLGNVNGIRLGEAYTSAYGYSARPAEAVTAFSGNEYSIQLLRIGKDWYISRL
ncbi:MAG: zinc ribbon domain-containing protein [Eubacteriales bacterium]|nr:zinc ribbon domain-containing protein [Eubacteriales bacterium]MDD3110396.1 zinc ribbon domain-containing protein [Eubacteriales bacterium]MDD4135080.1 zinc ribbon domain-containing protein [Eubacteriales bacterium]